MTTNDLTTLPDGGVEVAEEMTNLQIRQIDPDKIAVDEMNERQDEPLATEELERSVGENGVVEPPVCRVRDEDAEVPYAVVQGQRRVAAAQAVQLDEIPVLIGEFDDKRALIRSITENIKAGKKEVTTKTRAAAIWELWKLDQGGDCDPVPRPKRIGELLGVSNQTASTWIEPLRSEYANTAIDPRVRDETDNGVQNLSVDLDDVSADKLTRIRSIASDDTAEELVRRVEEEDLSVADVREMVQLDDAGEKPFQALEQVKQAREAAEEARGFMLDRVSFGDQTGGAIAQAARASGKNKSAVVKDAVQYYLREEGFL
jgi:hypothetical protein